MLENQQRQREAQVHLQNYLTRLAEQQLYLFKPCGKKLVEATGSELGREVSRPGGQNSVMLIDKGDAYKESAPTCTETRSLIQKTGE